MTKGQMLDSIFNSVQLSESHILQIFFASKDPFIRRLNFSIKITSIRTGLKDGAHYCYCPHFLRMPRQSRATRKKCATRRTRGLVLSPVSLGGSSYFLWKRCVVFQQMKNNFYLPCQFFENRRSMRMLLFLRMIDLTEHFIVKQKSILKHQKLLLRDVTLGAWVLKNPLIGKDQ